VRKGRLSDLEGRLRGLCGMGELLFFLQPRTKRGVEKEVIGRRREGREKGRGRKKGRGR
jgi:hypothetical protein